MIFPSNDSVSRQLLGSSGSLRLVPRLHGYYELLRIPAGHPAALRFLRLAIPPCARLFVSPRGVGTPPLGRGYLGCGFPNRWSDGGDGRASQVPGGPRVPMPCSPTPTEPYARPLRHSGAAFHHQDDVSFRIEHFGAQWHGLDTPRPTLRSPGHPGTTQGWVLAAGQLCQVGVATHRVPLRSFRSVMSSHPPRPGFAWRTLISFFTLTTPIDFLRCEPVQDPLDCLLWPAPHFFSTTVNVLPSPGELCTCTVPP